MAGMQLLNRMRDLGWGADADLWEIELDECHPADRAGIVALIRRELAAMEARELSEVIA